MEEVAVAAESGRAAVKMEDLRRGGVDWKGKI